MGKAYVDSSSEEEIREARGTVTQPGRPTQYRDRSSDENLDLFRRMRAGEFPDGAHVLRGRIDLAAKNMLLRDPVLYRIRHAQHYRTGGDWCIYPLYDYAHPIEDAIECVTHSLCTLEFDNNRALYDWVVENLPRGKGEFEIPPESHPEQTEFARLAVDYMMTSKRKLLQLVNDGFVSGWDDPRMPTVAGLRRRGVTPEALRAFVELVGVAKANSRVDVAKLEHAIRDDLNQRAPRVLCVLRPLRVVITNWPAGTVEQLDAPYWPHDVPKEGSREVPFSGELYIDRDDFMEDPPKGFFRLAPGREVRLRYGYIIRCDEVVRDAAGEVAELRCTYDPATRGGAAAEGRNVKGTVHWVSAAHSLPCEVRLYDRLFTVPDPDAAAGEDGDFRTFLNAESLVVVKEARIEPSLARAVAGDRFQFERLGYFALDPIDSRAGAPVFNRTVTLRDTWARITAGADAPSDGRPHRTKPVLTTQARPPATPVARAPRSAALDALRARFEREMNITVEQSDVLTRDAAIAEFFQHTIAAARAIPATVAKFVVNEVPRDARERINEVPLAPDALAALIDLVESGGISSSAAREVLAEMIERGGHPVAIVEQRGLSQVSDEMSLQGIVAEVLAANPAKVGEFRGGKIGLLGFFVGQTMAKTGGRANPAVVKRLLEDRLSSGA
jgi:glutaminyl-tRNA synthetase